LPARPGTRPGTWLIRALTTETVLTGYRHLPALGTFNRPPRTCLLPPCYPPRPEGITLFSALPRRAGRRAACSLPRPGARPPLTGSHHRPERRLGWVAGPVRLSLRAGAPPALRGGPPGRLMITALSRRWPSSSGRLLRVALLHLPVPLRGGSFLERAPTQVFLHFLAAGRALRAADAHNGASCFLLARLLCAF